jgi:chemotaxis methyl-accepting protein methylase
MITSQALETVVDRVSELLRERIGLRPDSTLRGRLHRAIRDEAAHHGRELTTYFDVLLADGAVLQSLLNRVTVQETAFFRHPEHFRVLARDILPALPQPVKIWSAGCANGQEAFSLAMLLEEQGIDGFVIATDLSTAALQRTAAARYTQRELTGLSPERIARHLTRTGDNWEVNKPIRDRVRTLHHNLLDPLPAEVQSCQVVFCRNVLIYLSPEHARAFLDRIADTLATTTLLLGAAETIWQVCDRFKAIPLGETFIYRQSATSAASAATRAERRTAPVDTGRAPIKSTVRARPSPVVASALTDPRSSMSVPVSVTGAGRPTVEPESAESAGLLARAAQDAMAAGDYDAAVIAFRKCAYLAPHDPVAQLHLGLALEAAGDGRSAQRAYAAARRALLEADPLHGVAVIEGYAADELVRLLDAKQRVRAQ